jgi:hypothetical protein
MQTTIQFLNVLLTRARAYAQARAVILAALIESALVPLMDQTESAASTDSSLPICIAGGDLRPGYSLESPNELLFDLDFEEEAS